MKQSKSHIARRFKVAAVSQQPNSFGLHGHVLIAEDGEAWEVGRSRGEWNSDMPFNQGDVVHVVLRSIDPDGAGDCTLLPSWESLSCEIPRRLPDAPTSVVRKVWKR